MLLQCLLALQLHVANDNLFCKEDLWVWALIIRLCTCTFVQYLIHPAVTFNRFISQHALHGCFVS